MQGWKLIEGGIKKTHLSDKEIWRYFNVLFSTKSRNQSSYKFGFVRSLIDNLYNVDQDLRLEYDKIYYTFCQVYWNLVVKYGLKQTDRSHKQSAIERILKNFQAKYEIPKEIVFDQLHMDLQLEALSKVKTEGKKYVVGAVYGDTEGTFYEFSTKKEYLRFNPVVYRFMQQFQQVILKLNNYDWARFLQKNNPVPQDFITAVECISKRSSLDYFRDILERFTEYKCFYCGADLKRAVVHVDHFIPWSYIHSDNLWNFVLACKKCNLAKRDKIPGRKFLHLLLVRNNILMNNSSSIIEKEFRSYSKKKILDLYRYAKRNGFDFLAKNIL